MKKAPAFRLGKNAGANQGRADKNGLGWLYLTKLANTPGDLTAPRVHSPIKILLATIHARLNHGHSAELEIDSGSGLFKRRPTLGR